MLQEPERLCNVAPHPLPPEQLVAWETSALFSKPRITLEARGRGHVTDSGELRGSREWDIEREKVSTSEGAILNSVGLKQG